MNPLLMSILLIVALTVFGRAMIRKIRLLSALEPTDRINHLKERLKNMVILAIGQKRLVGRAKERSSGIVHAFIFWGFCVLLIRSLNLYGQGFQEGFHLPFLGDNYLLGYLYIALKDIMEGDCLIDDHLGNFSSIRSKTKTIARYLRSLSGFGVDRDFDGVRSIARRRTVQFNSIL